MHATHHMTYGNNKLPRNDRRLLTDAPDFSRLVNKRWSFDRIATPRGGPKSFLHPWHRLYEYISG